MKRPIPRTILYLLCLYDVYLYLPDTLDLFDIDFYPPEIDALLYFDAAMLLVSGLIVGWLLRSSGGRFNNALGWTIIILNLVLTPWFIWKAIP